MTADHDARVSDERVVLSPRVPRGHRGLPGLRRNTYSRRKRGYSPLQRGSDRVVDEFEPHKLELLSGAGESAR